MAKIFEDEFTDIQADMIDICLEYIEKRAQKIFIYGSIEGKSLTGNVFYQINNKLVRVHEVNDAVCPGQVQYDTA